MGCGGGGGRRGALESHQKLKTLKHFTVYWFTVRQAGDLGHTVVVSTSASISVLTEDFTHDYASVSVTQTSIQQVTSNGVFTSTLLQTNTSKSIFT